MSYLSSYLEFHRRFQMPEPKKVTVEHAEMRLNFLLEELVETAEAAGYNLGICNKNGKDVIQFHRNKRLKVNKADYIDGLTDLLYVVLGTAAMSGLTQVPKGFVHATKLDIAFDKVHCANMKKIPVKNASESKRGTKFDMKKPEGWKAPDHRELLK